MNQKEPKEGYEWRIFIYICTRDGSAEYLFLDKDCENNGITPAKGRKVAYSNAKFGNGGAGTMFDIETKIDSEGGSILRPKKAISIGTWRRYADVINWQAEEKAVQDLVKLKKGQTEDYIRKQCEPLREAYSKLPAYTQDKAIFLARIMAEITRNIS